MGLFEIRKSAKNQKSQTQGAVGDSKAAVVKTRGKKTSDKGIASSSNVADQKVVAMPKGSFSTEADTIIRPHITEKSGIMSQNGVYVFQITKNANKPAVLKAIKALYKVTPVKVAVINVPAKNVFVRGKWGTVSGVKKALVTLKKGDKIDFV